MTEIGPQPSHPNVRPARTDPGDDDTFEALVRRHASAVLAVCLANTHSRHDAEDLVQEVFAHAFRKLHTLRDRGKARPWLLQIARRRCIDHRRRRRPTRLVPDDLPAPSEDRDPRLDRLHAALARLPDDYRETISLYYLDSRSCAGVAASLGISEAAVRQRLLRGRLMLHDLLTGDTQ